MNILDNSHYRTIASLLEEENGFEDGYFSGSISYSKGLLECTLTITLLIYRESFHFEDADFQLPMAEITDLVPIWWDFVTLRDGESEQNDFDFERLKWEICSR